MAGVFDFCNSINDAEQKDLIRTGEMSEKDYIPYMVNRQFSYFRDTVLYANLVNQWAHIDKQLQYDFLRLSIRPKKRYSKWFKPEENDDLDLIKEYYGYNTQKAAVALKILSADQINEIRNRVTEKGGKP